MQTHSPTAAHNRLWVVAPSKLADPQQQPIHRQQWVRCPTQSGSSRLSMAFQQGGSSHGVVCLQTWCSRQASDTNGWMWYWNWNFILFTYCFLSSGPHMFFHAFEWFHLNFFLVALKTVLQTFFTHFVFLVSPFLSLCTPAISLLFFCLRSFSVYFPCFL